MHNQVKQKININAWNRKEHYEFFSEFDLPYFGIVTTVDISKAHELCKTENISLFACYLFCSLKAANEVPEFGLRIEADEIFRYENLSASATVLRPDKTFAFTLVKYNGNFQDFQTALNAEYNAVMNSTGLRLNRTDGRNDVIHYSAVPLLNYTSVTHARNTKYKDSVPKLTFGKITQQNGKHMMPVSVDAHHALMDGYHVTQYLDLFQDNLDNFDKLI